MTSGFRYGRIAGQLNMLTGLPAAGPSGALELQIELRFYELNWIELQHIRHGGWL